MLLRKSALLVLVATSLALAETPPTDETQPGSVHIRAFGTLAWESYSLTSVDTTKTNSTAPNRMGSIFGGEVRYQEPQSPWFGGLRYALTRVDFLDTNFTPATVTLKRHEFGLMLGHQPFQSSSSEWLKNVWFSLGYNMLLSSAEATTPNTFIPTQSYFGFQVSVGTAKRLAVEWNLDFRADVFLPHGFTESSEKTGYYGGAWTVFASALIEHHLKRGLWIGTGLQYRFEKHNFSGTMVAPERNTDNATEIFKGFYIPVQLKVTL